MIFLRRRILIQWLLGMVIGTAFIGIVSPLTTRSYLPNQVSRHGIATLPTGYGYRWRSEGYATTRIGPHGMPGKVSIKDDDRYRIALWGDSQAEGVAVPDSQKLFAQMERESKGWQVFPLAKSGDGVGDWIAQMPWAESKLKADHHLILIVDLPDLADLAPPDPPTTGRLGGLTTVLPSFVVTAVRNVVTEPSGGFRKLRFSPGPVSITSVEEVANEIADDSATHGNKSLGADKPEDLVGVDQQLVAQAERAFDQILDAAKSNVTILYAPPRPIISGGKIQWEDPHFRTAEVASDAAMRRGIKWIDASKVLRELGEKGQFPHGFANGQIGVGHLNRTGYHALAKLLSQRMSLDHDGGSAVLP